MPQCLGAIILKTHQNLFFPEALCDHLCQPFNFPIGWGRKSWDAQKCNITIYPGQHSLDILRCFGVLPHRRGDILHGKADILRKHRTSRQLHAVATCPDHRGADGLLSKEVFSSTKPALPNGTAQDWPDIAKSIVRKIMGDAVRHTAGKRGDHIPRDIPCFSRFLRR